MIPGAFPDALAAGYHELDYLERRLKRANNNDTLRGVHVSLSRFRSSQLESASPAAKARYSMLQGVVYAKGATQSQTSWLGHSSVECLFYALDQFADAEEILGTMANNEFAGRLPDFLLRLRQANAYEAATVVTRLQSWGEPLSKLKVTPNTGSLSAEEQNRIKRALDHGYAISSRF